MSNRIIKSGGFEGKVTPKKESPQPTASYEDMKAALKKTRNVLIGVLLGGIATIESLTIWKNSEVTDITPPQQTSAPAPEKLDPEMPLLQNVVQSTEDSRNSFENLPHGKLNRPAPLRITPKDFEQENPFKKQLQKERDSSLTVRSNSL